MNRKLKELVKQLFAEALAAKEDETPPAESEAEASGPAEEAKKKMPMPVEGEEDEMEEGYVAKKRKGQLESEQTQEALRQVQRLESEIAVSRAIAAAKLDDHLAEAAQVALGGRIVARHQDAAELRHHPRCRPLGSLLAEVQADPRPGLAD